MKKTTRKKERKLIKKITWAQQRQEKKSWIIDELKVHKQSKN